MASKIEIKLTKLCFQGRFENRFYRRVTAAQFDVRYLATNTEKFNEVHSAIVKQARIVTDLCLKIIKLVLFIALVLSLVSELIVIKYKISNLFVNLVSTRNINTSTTTK